MQNTDLGKLVARVLAVFLAITAFVTLRMSWNSFNSEYARTFEKALALAVPITYLLAAVLAWVFADRFAPQDPAGQETRFDAQFVGAVVIAATFSYIFLNQSWSLIDEVIRTAQDKPVVGPPRSIDLFFDTIVSAGCVAVVLNARRVAKWVGR